MVFVKQYGEKRTGTNLVRAMLEYYFDEVQVLMHIPGDKHSSPVDYNLLRECLLAPCDAASTLKTFSEMKAGNTTNFLNSGQLDFLEQVAPLLRDAIINNKLCFCITIKNPFAWIVSISKWEGWKATDMSGNGRFIPYVRGAVCRYNDKYRSWLNLKEIFPERTSVVRYENLIGDPMNIIGQIGSLTGVGHSKKTEKPFDGIILPCHWDDQLTVMHHAAFDKTFYNERRYLTVLPSEAIHTISEHIDRELMKSYGYNNIEEWIN